MLEWAHFVLLLNVRYYVVVSDMARESHVQIKFLSLEFL